MRMCIAMLGLAALASSAAAQVQPPPAAKEQTAPSPVTHDLRTNVIARTGPAGAAAAEIAAIEQAWGEAFLKGDRAYIEQLVAPEFKLLRGDGGRSISP